MVVVATGLSGTTFDILLLQTQSLCRLSRPTVPPGFGSDGAWLAFESRRTSGAQSTAGRRCDRHQLEAACYDEQLWPRNVLLFVSILR